MNKDLLLLCAQLEPNHVSNYLKINGWKPITFVKKNNYRIFQIEKGNELFQVNIPLHSEFEDYLDLMYDLVVTLGRYEDSDPLFVVNRILNPYSDIIKIRASNNRIYNGSMPIDDAVHFFEQAKKLLTDAAMDVVSKIKHRTSKCPAEVSDFISRCRFGQTEVGSYVLSIICPFDNNDLALSEQQALFGDDFVQESTTRKIVKKIVKSTKQVSKAIENNEDLSGFINEVNEDFISLNFIEDLSELADIDNDSFIEIKAEYNKQSANSHASDSIVFKTSYGERLNKFVENYKKNEKNEKNKKHLIGYVSKVSADPILENRNTGEATIEEKNTNKKYKVCLKKEDYSRIVNAHQNGWLVTIDVIDKDGLFECESLSIMEEISLF